MVIFVLPVKLKMLYGRRLIVSKEIKGQNELEPEVRRQSRLIQRKKC